LGNYKKLFSKEDISHANSNFNTNYTNFFKSPSRGSISTSEKLHVKKLNEDLKLKLNEKPVIDNLIHLENYQKFSRGIH
jgi:hypothetical protein